MVDQYFVKKTGDDKVILKYKHGDKTVTKTISELYSLEVASIDCMDEDIEMLAHDCGMRSLVHADKQPISTNYVNEFAEHYKSILQKTLREISKKLDLFYDTIFSININDLAKPVAKRLRVQMKEEKKEAGKLAVQASIIQIHWSNKWSKLIRVWRLIAVVLGISTIMYVHLLRSNLSISQNWPRKNLFGQQYWKLVLVSVNCSILILVNLFLSI